MWMADGFINEQIKETKEKEWVERNYDCVLLFILIQQMQMFSS